jgi:flagellar hook-associated protein 2
VVSISSVTSGANSIQTLVDQFIAPERRPITDLEKSKTDLNRRLAVFSDLKTKLNSFRDIVRSFSSVGSLNVLSKKTATSSNTNLLKVSAEASAIVGNYAVRIDRLAASDTGISVQLERDGTFLSGKSSGLQEFTISVGSGDPVTISVNVDPADTDEDVMNKIRDAINDSGIADVSASVIQDTSTTARLVIKSTKAGSDNVLNLTGINGSDILESLEFVDKQGKRQLNSGTGGGFRVQDAADLDAWLNVDGVDIVKGTNEISDIIIGVTIKLLGVQEPGDAPMTVTIGNDISNAKSEIEEFIEQYNEAITYLNEKTKVDTVKFTRGDFTGNATFTGLKFSLRSAISNFNTGLPSEDLQFLSQIGLTTSREGTLSIKDSEKLDDALTTKLDQVSNLFSAENGIAKSLETLLDRFVSSGGAVDRGRNSIKRQLNSIDVRIKNYEARLVIREESLRRKFTDLQRMLNLLSSQQAAMQSIFSFQQNSSSGFF